MTEEDGGDVKGQGLGQVRRQRTEKGKGERRAVGNVGSQGSFRANDRRRCAQTEDRPEAALTHQTDVWNLLLSRLPMGAPGGLTQRWPLLCDKGLGGFFLSLH